MRDISEIKKFIADQEERVTGKRPEYTDLIRISDAAHWFKMLEAEPLNIDGVSNTESEAKGAVCKHVWNLQPDSDGKFRCVDCNYESPIQTDY